MVTEINETHDPHTESWVESAQDPNTDFPVQNLPFGVFSPSEPEARARIGIAIGRMVLDLGGCAEANLLEGIDDESRRACRASMLNEVMGLSSRQVSGLRKAVHALLRRDVGKARRVHAEQYLHSVDAVRLLVPAEIGDYTDFYASIYHATNCGRLFRPDNPLMPNYRYVPIAYHGRASSIIVSGSPVRRPAGQQRISDTEVVFEPTKRLDYELELGFFIGPGNALGEPISIDTAEEHLFGFCLANDWSARDIQTWEMAPLGPFLSKSFATSISPWVVTREALAPFRGPAFVRTDTDPQPLPYLWSLANEERGGINLDLAAYILTPTMREQGGQPFQLSRANFRTMYWTPAQMVAHHTSNGCNLQPGDMLASGTVSEQEPGAFGSLLEITKAGRERISLPNGETRGFLEDGDEIVFRATCSAAGFARIGFGECRGRVAPARARTASGRPITVTVNV
jgi:fumarylacetoacetase